MNWAIEEKSYSQARACALVGLAPKTYRYQAKRGGDEGFRKRLRELADERRRFGYRRLHLLLCREGMRLNRKKLYRLYKEERLTVRARRRKRALGTRRQCAPARINQRCHLILSPMRYRQPTLSRACSDRRLQPGMPALVVDISLSASASPANSTASPIAAIPASSSATTARADLKCHPEMQEERRVEWHYIAPGKPMQNGLQRVLSAFARRMLE